MPTPPLRHLPALILLLGVIAPSFASAAPLKQKYELGPWERDIGYAQAVRVGNTLHISGAVGSGPMPEAVRGAFDTLRQTLAHYGLSFAHVVKETIYTTDIEALKQAQEVRKSYYAGDYPAATWVQVSRLYMPDHVVEVELVAVFDDPPAKEPSHN